MGFALVCPYVSDTYPLRGWSHSKVAMSVHRLDIQGRPIRPGQRRKPAARIYEGERQYHYEIRWKIPRPDGPTRNCKRHERLISDRKAHEREAELRGTPSTDATVVWSRAWREFKVPTTTSAHSPHSTTWPSTGRRSKTSPDT